MANTPIYPMRLSEQTKQRWAEAALERDHTSLVEFIKFCVEKEIESETPPPRVSSLLQAAASAGGKVFKGPDPKGGKAKT